MYIFSIFSLFATKKIKKIRARGSAFLMVVHMGNYLKLQEYIQYLKERYENFDISVFNLDLDTAVADKVNTKNCLDKLGLCLGVICTN